jgi:hypothetical protein
MAVMLLLKFPIILVGANPKLLYVGQHGLPRIDQLDYA